MIESIKIRNFQVHKSRVIQLNPHVNTITGPSDSGKSSILRALRWVVFNRPAGNAFIKTGTDTTKVIITLKDGTIIRTKGKKNAYQLNDDLYKAFGSDVPPDILRALKLSEINFQNQHDAPFWFSETAGEVSRQLNQIVNLGVIDTTLSNLASMMRQARTEVDVVESRLREAKAERTKYKFARQMDLAMKQLEGQRAGWLAVRRRSSELDTLFADVQRYREDRDRTLQAHCQGRLVLETGEKWQSLANRRFILGETIEAVTSLKQTLKKKIPNLQPLEQLEAQWRKTNQRARALQEILDSIEEAGRRKCQSEKSHKIEARQLKKLMGTTCLLCGQKIPS